MTAMDGQTVPTPPKEAKLTERPRKRVVAVGKLGPAFAPGAVVLR